MKLRTLLDVLVLTVFALLPAVIAGCSSARGYESSRPRHAAAPTSSGAIPDPLTGQGGIQQLVSPQSMPAPQEELWVIQKQPDAPFSAADVPGSGAMVVPRGDQLVPIPLKHTDVKATIAGYIGTVDVTQQFHNPYEGKIEAVYVFPLPHNAAVNEFVMTVGDRRIRGIIREREEAKRIYEQARGQGYVASLLEQDRPNVFMQRVANIEPGKRIDVSVRYFHTLSYSDGWYEWVFPMVVGPRFNPPGTTDGIGAAGRASAGASKQTTEVQYLRPGERSGHDVAVAVKIDALVPVEAVESRTHKVNVTRRSPRQFEVALDDGDAIPNRDFVLRWKVAGDGVKSGLIVQKDKSGTGGHFALMLVPPQDLRRLPRSPVEMVFTLDVSGSMNGRPIEQARSAVRWALAHLRADDTFNIVRFADGANVMADRPLPATPNNLKDAMRYVETTSAGGGTMMLDGLRRALESPPDQSRPRYVVFLTDGFIGNEPQILGALQKSLGASRVFSIGVGSATNRYLLEHMAKLGRGAVAFLGPRDSAEDVMSAYFAAISHPAMTDLSLACGGPSRIEVYPQRLPDLFVGRPVTLVGRFEGEPPQSVKLTGRVRDETQVLDVTVEDAGGADLTALPSVWARMKIADLGDRLALDPQDRQVPTAVRHLALEHGLMSAYTAFIAVDSLTRTAGDHGTTVATPVPVPEGTTYETTVAQ